MQRLLIVEDQPGMLTALEIALSSDFEVCTALSAEECMSIAAGFQPRVILADFKLQGHNGLELVKTLAHFSHKPIIVLISSAMDEQLRAEAMQMGVAACFGKPFDLEILKSTLHQLADA
jgi:two-component system response regulator HydG